MKNKAVFLLMVISAGSIFSQTLRINELMYAPTGGEPEWIELYNSSNDSVNVRNWKVRNKNRKFYTLTNTDFYVLPNSYLVVTKSDTIFTFHPTIPSRVLICPALPSAFMVNTGDTISLHDSTGALIDSVFYAPSWGGSGGKSLERISHDISPFLYTNWGTSLDAEGSTPGRKNSIAANQYDLKITSFSASLNSSQLTATFKVMVKNSGTQATSAFEVNVFVDYNDDHAQQSDELAASSSDIPGLMPRDSTEITLQATVKTERKLYALAVVKFFSDEDTTNNFMWTQLNISYPAKSVVVNEIMYAPRSPEPEWVELFNPSKDSIDLNGFTLADNSNTKAELTTANYLLLPGAYVVAAHDSNFFNAHPLAFDKVLITKIPSLNNTGDVVAIHDAAGNLIDSVSYSPSWGGNASGKSLERILATGDSNDPQNFETSTDSSRSTPGRINSVTPRDFDLAIGTISYYPSSLQSGDSATIFVNILNRGLEISGLAAAILFNDLNGNGKLDWGEFIDSAEVQALNPNDSTTVSLTSGELGFATYHLGIMINYPDDELTSNNIKIVLVHIGLPRGSVIINEIMYAPKSPEQEWIELYNARDTVVDLSNFKVVTHGGTLKITAGSLVAPNGFAVICRDSSVSRLHYPVKNLILQPTPSLSNSGDGIGLYNNFGNLLDTMNYIPSYGGSKGKSLERLDYLAGNDSTNWQESADSTGATPGIMNSNAILPFDIALKRLKFSPTAVDVSEQGDINLVMQNVGRNAISGVILSVQVSNCLDGTIVLSESGTVDQILLPHDSATANFIFTPTRPGTHKISAKIFQQQDERQRNDTLSAWFNVRYHTQNIVINEIMYSSERMGEYFEICNTSGDPIDLGGWTYHTSSLQPKPICATSASVSGGHSSTIPILLLPSRYLVVANDTTILNFAPDSNCVYLSKSLALRDNGDCLVIMDPAETVVDSVCYSPSWHNSDIAHTSGRSLEKINPTLSSNDKTSWSTCVSENGGTPGKRNSLFVNAGAAIGGITVDPNPFSPDGDGHDDFTFVNYSFPVSSVKIRIRIFDSIGRLIATPVDNAILPSNGKLVWDGRDGSGKIVKFGLYILLVDVAGPDGRSLSTYKKPLVVAKRMR